MMIRVPGEACGDSTQEKVSYTFYYYEINNRETLD